MIEMDGRTFIVTLDDAGDVRSIKVRKVYASGRPYEAIYNSPYWHHSAKVPTRGRAAAIIAEAKRRNQETHGQNP